MQSYLAEKGRQDNKKDLRTAVAHVFVQEWTKKSYRIPPTNWRHICAHSGRDEAKEDEENLRNEKKKKLLQGFAGLKEKVKRASHPA